MTKIIFRKKRFSWVSLQKIDLCNQIIDEYIGQGLHLTLRQLYYQLVTRNTILNEEREYKNLSTLVSNARLAGIIDWEAIEDRIRQPRAASEFKSIEELIDVALKSYRLPRWNGQTRYAELWVEKDALASVLEPLAHEFHVTLMVNRGYSSQSAMFDAAIRFRVSKKPGILFYLGDMDPSGEDMVRDIQDRLKMFYAEVEVKKIALTMSQVEQYDPPPNPTKMTDPRASEYVMVHGNESWEVDALPPNILTQIIRQAFRRVVNRAVMDAVKEQEERDKVRFRQMMKKLGGET